MLCTKTLILIFDLTALHHSTSNRYYFTASWCPPCKAIAPIFEKLSNDFPDLTFAKIDVDDVQEAAVENSIRSVPTFMFFNGEDKMSEFAGADQDMLVKNLSELNSK